MHTLIQNFLHKKSLSKTSGTFKTFFLPRFLKIAKANFCLPKQNTLLDILSRCKIQGYFEVFKYLTFIKEIKIGFSTL